MHNVRGANVGEPPPLEYLVTVKNNRGQRASRPATTCRVYGPRLTENAEVKKLKKTREKESRLLEQNGRWNSATKTERDNLISLNR